MAFVVVQIPSNISFISFNSHTINSSGDQCVKLEDKNGKSSYVRGDKESCNISEYSLEMQAALNAQHKVLYSFSVNKGSFSSLCSLIPENMIPKMIRVRSR